MVYPKESVMNNTFYFTSLGDPVAFLVTELPVIFSKISNPAKVIGDERMLRFDRGVFASFMDSYGEVHITSGLPRNDYGQTVRLSSVVKEAWVLSADYKQLSLPLDFIGENLPVKPHQMKTQYYVRTRQTSWSIHGHVLEEEFFFPFVEGYAPSTWSELQSNIDLLAYVSNCLHRLSVFHLSVSADGVYVSLASHVTRSNRLAFQMAF